MAEAASAGFGSGYGAAQPRPVALLLVVVLHALALTVLLTQKMLLPPDKAPEAMLVVNVPLPLRLAPPPDVDLPDVRLEVPDVVVPPPMIEIARETVPAITARLAEPAPAPVAPAVVPAAMVGQLAPAGPPALQTLPATMLEAVPPRYPLESRQRREQGTVVLDVLLSPGGTVEKIAVHSSSGSPRLDKAALDAVRRWRWSPSLRNGVAVAVRGLVEIPFVLTRR